MYSLSLGHLFVSVCMRIEWCMWPNDKLFRFDIIVTAQYQKCILYLRLMPLQLLVLWNDLDACMVLLHICLHMIVWMTMYITWSDGILGLGLYLISNLLVVYTRTWLMLPTWPRLFVTPAGCFCLPLLETTVRSSAKPFTLCSVDEQTLGKAAAALVEVEGWVLWGLSTR